ncbi:MotA/TolQ/ExbB proton channel family protein [Rheinheimera sp.]|uniref:MotA/TolQ/ExbB proton channel family protein n=1 Tax=Rheinheimera sp. TaxID=1869214 RepID=UPI00307D83B4
MQPMKKTASPPIPPGPLPPHLQPPLLSQLLLEWLLPEFIQEAILGDLQEEFILRQQQSRSQACWWYRQQCLQTAWHYLLKTKGDLLMFVLSLLSFVVLSGWAMWVSSPDDPLAFYDFVSLVLIVPTSLMFAVGATSRQTLRQALALLVDSRQPLCAQHYRQAGHFFDIMGQSALLMGIFSTLIGVIAIANNLTAAEFASAFGPATGVCLLTLLYGYGLKTLCYVAAQKVRFRAEQASPAADPV